MSVTSPLSTAVNQDSSYYVVSYVNPFPETWDWCRTATLYVRISNQQQQRVGSLHSQTTVHILTRAILREPSTSDLSTRPLYACPSITLSAAILIWTRLYSCMPLLLSPTSTSCIHVHHITTGHLHPYLKSYSADLSIHKPQPQCFRGCG